MPSFVASALCPAIDTEALQHPDTHIIRNNTAVQTNDAAIAVARAGSHAVPGIIEMPPQLFTKNSFSHTYISKKRSHLGRRFHIQEAVNGQKYPQHSMLRHPLQTVTRDYPKRFCVCVDREHKTNSVQ